MSVSVSVSEAFILNVRLKTTPGFVKRLISRPQGAIRIRKNKFVLLHRKHHLDERRFLKGLARRSPSGGKTPAARGAVQIIRGKTLRHKTIWIGGLSAGEVLLKLFEP